MVNLPRLDIAWKPAKSLVYHVAAAVTLAVLLLWQLNLRPPGASAQEITLKQTSNLSALGSNVLFAPWRLAQDLFLHIDSHSLASLRLPSVFVALLAVAAFYYLTAAWFGKAIGFLSAVLLATTPFYILLGRNGLPDSMYLLLSLLLAAYVYLTRNYQKKPKLTLGLFIVSASLCFYIPGLIYIVLLGGVLKWRQLTNLGLTSQAYYVAAGLLLILLSPLIYDLATHPHLVKSLFLVPDHFDKVTVILKTWAWMILAIFIKAKQHTALMIDRLPILDVAQAGLFLFGAYVMWARLRGQFYTLVGLILLITLLAAINNSYNLLAPALILLGIACAMGLRFLYIEWVHVFPRNPIPRYFAITLMALVVVVHVVYGIRYGLIAWPATVATQHLYMLKLN